MDSNTRLASIIIALTLSTSGCAYLQQTGSTDVAAPYAILPVSFEDLDLPKILGDEPIPSFSTEADKGRRIDSAIVKFNHHYANDNAAGKRARNQIQDRLIAASIQRCNAFKANLQRGYSRTNFGLGVASTVTGIAGALVPGLQASKNLSGISAAFGGTRAEFNQDFFSNLTTNIIAEGIDALRADYKEKIATKRISDFTEYTMEGALGDAIHYHGLCSMISGLQYAGKAIRMTVDPGLGAAARIMDNLNTLKSIANNGDYSAALARGRANFSPSDGAPVATLFGGGLGNESDIWIYQRAKSAEDRINGSAQLLKASIETSKTELDTLRADFEKDSLKSIDTFQTGLAKSCFGIAKTADSEIREMLADMPFTQPDKVPAKRTALEAKQNQARYLLSQIEIHVLTITGPANDVRRFLDKKHSEKLKIDKPALDVELKKLTSPVIDPKLCSV
jgi:hypothetical protein